MLRLRWLFPVMAVTMILGGTVGSHVALSQRAVPAIIADGTDPMPPPFPLAIPDKSPPVIIADGTDPMPPPFPLAVPGRSNIAL